MSDFDYHVVALIPPDPRFDIEAVIETLSLQGYKAERAERLGSLGFRVVEDDGWGITAWLEADDEAREHNKILSERDVPEGATPGQIAACPAQLSIWSDDDSDMMNAHVFEEFIQFLKARFGCFLFDNRLGEWR